MEAPQIHHEACIERKSGCVSDLRNEDISTVDINTAWQNGGWQPVLPDAILYRAQKSPTLENIYLAIKAQHAIKGLNSTSLQCFSQLLIKSREKAQWSRGSIRMLCALLQLGYKDWAHEWVSQFLPGKCTLLKSRLLTRFPAALRFLYEYYPEKISAQQAKVAHLSISFLEQIDYVDEMFLHSLPNQQKISALQKLKVAIVGNGPSLLTDARGQCIDSHDIVIRFNNYVLNDTYKKHTGEKTDLHIISPNLAKPTSHRITVPLAITGINIFHGESGYWQHLASLPQDRKLAVFDQRIWYGLVKELSAPPSAGLLTIASLVALPALQVNTFGFNTDVKNESMSVNSEGKSFDNTTKRNHYGDNLPASVRHNWRSEAKVITRLIHDKTDDAISE